MINSAQVSIFAATQRTEGTSGLPSAPPPSPGAPRVVDSWRSLTSEEVVGDLTDRRWSQVAEFGGGGCEFVGVVVGGAWIARSRRRGCVRRC